MLILREFFGPTIWTQILAGISVVLTVVVISTSVSMIFHRQLHGFAGAMLAHNAGLGGRIMATKTVHGETNSKTQSQETGIMERNTFDSVIWRQIHNFVSRGCGPFDPHHLLLVKGLLKNAVLSDFARSTLHDAIGEWVAAGLEGQQSKTLRDAYVNALVNALGTQVGSSQSASTSVKSAPSRTENNGPVEDSKPLPG